MPTIMTEMQEKNQDFDAERKAEWASRIEEEEALRGDIAKNVEVAFRDAQLDEGVEDAGEIAAEIERRFGAPAATIIDHFRTLDAEMRRDPIGSMSLVQEFLSATASGAPGAALSDLKPATEKAKDALLRKIAAEAGDDIRGDVARAMLETGKADQLREAMKGLPGSPAKALQRILDVAKLAERDPRLAAASWATTAGFAPASTQHHERQIQHLEAGLGQLLDTRFRDLEPHLDEIAAMFNRGDLKPSGDLNRDLENARGLLKRKRKR